MFYKLENENSIVKIENNEIFNKIIEILKKEKQNIIHSKLTNIYNNTFIKSQIKYKPLTKDELKTAFDKYNCQTITLHNIIENGILTQNNENDYLRNIEIAENKKNISFYYGKCAICCIILITVISIIVMHNF